VVGHVRVLGNRRRGAGWSEIPLGPPFRGAVSNRLLQTIVHDSTAWRQGAAAQQARRYRSPPAPRGRSPPYRRQPHRRSPREPRSPTTETRAQRRRSRCASHRCGAVAVLAGGRSEHALLHGMSETSQATQQLVDHEFRSLVESAREAAPNCSRRTASSSTSSRGPARCADARRRRRARRRRAPLAQRRARRLRLRRG
jgi:hypothetical protein